MNRFHRAVRAVMAAAVLAPAAIMPSALLAQTAAPAPSAPAPAPAGAPRPINPAVLAKLLKLIASAGADIDVPVTVAGPLGLGDGKAWPARQFAVHASATGSVHAVALGRGDDQDIVFSVRGPAAVSVFRAHRDGTLVTATNLFEGTNQATTLPPGEAQADFAAEGAFWAANVDAVSTEY